MLVHKDQESHFATEPAPILSQVVKSCEDNLFQFQAIFPNQTLLQKDVRELAPVLSRRGALGGSLRAMMLLSVAKTPGPMCPHPPPPATR